MPQLSPETMDSLGKSQTACGLTPASSIQTHLTDLTITFTILLQATFLHVETKFSFLSNTKFIYYWNVHLQYNYKGAMSTGVSHTLYEGSFYLGMKEICCDKDSLQFLRYSGRAIQTYRLLCSPLLNRIELWRADQQVAIKKSICNPFF